MSFFSNIYIVSVSWVRLVVRRGIKPFELAAFFRQWCFWKEETWPESMSLWLSNFWFSDQNNISRSRNSGQSFSFIFDSVFIFICAFFCFSFASFYFIDILLSFAQCVQHEILWLDTSAGQICKPDVTHWLSLRTPTLSLSSCLPFCLSNYLQVHIEQFFFFTFFISSLVIHHSDFSTWMKVKSILLDSIILLLHPHLQ